METLRLSAGAQPGRAVRAGAVFFVSGEASASQSQGEPPRALLGVLDESGRFGNGRRVELGIGTQSIPVAPACRVAGGWLGGCVAVLRAASIRGSLLGTWR